MSGRNLNLFFAVVSLLCFAGLSWAQAAQNPSIVELNRNGGQYADQMVAVSGRLQMAGANYFTDPRFVLSDDQGNRVAVSPWVVLEVPPPMPGAVGEPPLTMRSFLGRFVLVTGVVRVEPGGTGVSIAVQTAEIVPNVPPGAARATPSGSTNPPRTASADTVAGSGGAGPVSGGSASTAKVSPPAGAQTPQRTRVQAASSAPVRPAVPGPAQPTGVQTAPVAPVVPDPAQPTGVQTAPIAPVVPDPARPSGVRAAVPVPAASPVSTSPAKPVTTSSAPNEAQASPAAPAKSPTPTVAPRAKTQPQPKKGNS